MISKVQVGSSTTLSNRTYGFEFSGSEYRLLFEYDNMGYVRFLDRFKTRFQLDPSPFLQNPHKQIYIIEKNCLPPPEGKLIEATVRETERIIGSQKSPNSTLFNSTLAKYVMDWKLVDPNKIVYDRLVHKEEFLNFLSLPIPRDSYNYEDLQICLGMSMVSSPQLSYFEPGGINTLVLGGSHLRSSWAAFKRSAIIVPNEFRKTTATHFYKHCETAEILRPVNSREVCLSYPEVREVPVHIPLPLEFNMRSLSAYQEDLKYFTPIARTFLLDAILFQPDIPDTLQKRLEEAMYEIIENVTFANDVPYNQDLGSVILKLTSSFARLDFTSKVTKDNLEGSKDIWGEMMGLARRTISGSWIKKDIYNKNDDDLQIIYELQEMVETGIPLTIPNLKARTKVPIWKFEDTLDRLRTMGDIYFPKGDRIGFVNQGKN